MPVEPDITQFWTVSEQFQQGITDPFKGDEQEAIQTLDAMLKRSIGLRMVADVPLGAFLSGGVDSSTLVALMQSQTKHKVKTFTVGFNQAGYDEARHALPGRQSPGDRSHRILRSAARSPGSDTAIACIV